MLTDRHQPTVATAPIDGGTTVDRLTVTAWWDPALAVQGLDPRSPYAERFWLGIVGPSTLLLLRRLARGLEEHPNGFRVSIADTARALGLGPGLGRNGPLNRTVDRACTFGLARRRAPDRLEVRTHLPPLTARQVAQLPEALRVAHDAWQRSQADGTPRPTDPTGPAGPRAA
jgi:hypothetical protein